MPVELTPITDADIAAVAAFLHANLNDRVAWDRAILSVPWKVEAPNHGFMHSLLQRINCYAMRWVRKKCRRLRSRETFPMLREDNSLVSGYVRTSTPGEMVLAE
ncbi:MAG TPA: hypothetical protein VF060_06100 [Trebonia sp.]